MTEQNFEIISKRKVVQLSATFLVITFLFASCKKEETTIGDSLQGEGLNVVTSDTFSLITYSDELDSMESDETSVALLGAYNDPVFGGVDCGIVTQIRLSTQDPNFGALSDIVVDSVVLGLAYTGINYYANLDDITVEVYEVTEDLVRDDQVYHTFKDPANTGTNLVLSGTEVITPDPIGQQIVGDDTLSAHLRINLDPLTAGNTLVALNDNGSMATDAGFVDAFKGLYVKANASSLANGQGGVFYFSMENSLSSLTLYFHLLSDPGNAEKYVFNINNDAARYNKMDFDRTGTDVESLLVDPSLGSEAFYTQSGAIWAIVEFPYLSDLYLDSLGNKDPKIINRAELILPVQDFTADGFDPAVNLFIARILDDKTSDFTLDYSLTSVLGGNTVKYDQTNKEYKFTMTREVQAILNEERENSGFRIYTPSFFASSVERIIFNGTNSDLKNKPRLEITYTDY
jgi:hypothetical protein